MRARRRSQETFPSGRRIAASWTGLGHSAQILAKGPWIQDASRCPSSFGSDSRLTGAADIHGPPAVARAGRGGLRGRLMSRRIPI